MSGKSEITRRAALAAGATGATAAALAACSTGGGSAGGPGTANRVKPGQKVAELQTITVGSAVAADLDGQQVIVARPTSSTAACFSAICTHMGCTVTPAGEKLNCPCHGSQYDALTGKVLRGPASQPLAKIPVAVHDGAVVTAAKKKE
jgi:Rieske Fe-S protein